jgi:HEAT repeat protein
MSEPAAHEAPTRSQSPPPGRRVTITLIVVLLTLWLTALWYRMEIRACWWAYRITRVESLELQGYYAACLGSVGDKALPALPMLLDDPRPSVRLIGVCILRSCPAKAALEKLLACLDDPSTEVSSAAALEIALRPDRLSVLPILEARLAGPAGYALPAMAAIERIGGPEAERILLDTLAGSDDPDVVAQAIDSLGMLGCKAAEQAIRQHLDDHRRLQHPPASQRRAEQAIAAVNGLLIARGIDPQALKSAARTDPAVSAVAARALASIVGPPATSTAPETGSAPAESP